MSMIRTEHLAKSFGELVVLKDINLTVEPGEVVVIIGPSGAGKSTFLRSLNNLEKITSGKIFIEDKLFYHRENDRTVTKWKRNSIRTYCWKWEWYFSVSICSHIKPYWKMSCWRRCM